MKISEKQLLMLVDIAQDTCRMGTIVGGYTPQTRVQLVNDIINQQSDTPKEVEPENDDLCGPSDHSGEGPRPPF